LTVTQTERRAGLLRNSPFYAGFAVDDLAKAKQFYADTLGVFPVVEIGESLLSLHAGNGYAVLVYEKPSHTPAEHTVLNFPVDDIEAAVDELCAAGVESSTTTRGRSRRTRRASPRQGRSRPGSGIPQGTSSR